MPEGISCLVNGDYKVGEYMTKDKRIPLISATGSTRMGKIVASEVGARLGKSLLELGGNNAIIVTPDADVKMTVMGAVFGAVGTAGQRCTSTRRLIIHEDIYNEVRDAVVSAYKQIKIGNPLDQSNHVGPLIDTDAVKMYLQALEKIKKQGGNIIVEGGQLDGKGFESRCYVKPSIAEAKPEYEIVQEETFAPILYLLKYSGDVVNAIEIQNNVNQGLSSARNLGLKHAEGEFIQFLDSDDLLPPKKIENHCNFLNENKNVDVVYADCKTFVNNDKNRLYDWNRRHLYMNGNIFLKLIESSFLLPHMPLSKKNVLNSIGGFDTNLTNCIDYDFCGEECTVLLQAQTRTAVLFNLKSRLQ